MRSGHPEVFLEKGVLKICSKFTGKHPCWSVILVKLQSSFIKIRFQYGSSPVHLLHIFRISFTKNTSGRLPLGIAVWRAKLLSHFLHLSLVLLVYTTISLLFPPNQWIGFSQPTANFFVLSFRNNVIQHLEQVDKTNNFSVK